MRSSVSMQQQACSPENQNHSRRMRWTSEDPPKRWYIGLWGPNIDNELIALTKKHWADLSMVDLHEPHIDNDGMKSDRGPARDAAPPRESESSAGTRKVTPSRMYCFPEFTSHPRDRPRGDGKIAGLLRKARALWRGLYLLDAAIDNLLIWFISRSSRGLAHLRYLAKSTRQLGRQIWRHVFPTTQVDPGAFGKLLARKSRNQLANWQKLQYLTIAHATVTNEALAAI